MRQTRTLSVSDTSQWPTQGFGFLASWAYSSRIAAGHSVSERLLAGLSTIDRAMVVLRTSLAGTGQLPSRANVYRYPRSGPKPRPYPAAIELWQDRRAPSGG